MTLPLTDSPSHVPLRSRSPRRYAGSQPTPIQLTARDARILETINAFDGLISLKQIERLFFPGQGGSWARERMRALTAHDYVRQPRAQERHLVPVGESVYWLGKAGAELVAGLDGEGLRRSGWRRRPRWSQLAHDLAVNDFRITVQAAVAVDSALSIREWLSEGEFLAAPDTISFRNRQGKKQKRQIRPDGFFAIQQRIADGKSKDFAYLLEIDMATEHNPRFVREKILPGLAYLKSGQYRQRCGYRFGRWLVVTSGERRLQNMVRHAERAGAGGMFYFTTFARITDKTILHGSIWQVVGQRELKSLMPTHP